MLYVSYAVRVRALAQGARIVVVDFLIILANNHVESQISRDGISFEVPTDVARLFVFS